MKNYMSLREEALKNSIRKDFFYSYDCTVLGNIDFVVAKADVDSKGELVFDFDDKYFLKSILWAEAKQGNKHDIYESFVQLILTIGKEKTFEKELPPKFIGAFDAEKIAFIEYNKIQDVFYQNDFNWNVTPSNHETKEFKLLYSMSKKLLEENSIFFTYDTQEKELREFLKLNFKRNKNVTEKYPVTLNNFTFVFQKWCEKVKPTIDVDWNRMNKVGIISADFFLADLISENEQSLKENLYVTLKDKIYNIKKGIDSDTGRSFNIPISFKDGQKTYNEFWSVYERPPKEIYWEFIIGRRDLLVPQDIRERKGSFFTPQIWVQKSQEYLADVLGENWQNEYYIWDCCSGTGNLLTGLTNYDNVWASTLDKADVDVMLDRIKNGWGMPENHVFQFDFLNDDFSKCPEELQEILNSEEKRKKLVIYINPPYAEAGDSKQLAGTGKNKDEVSTNNKTYEKYKDLIGKASNEIYAQFFIRIYKEIPNCILGEFSKLKVLQAPNFENFRNVFIAKLEKLFIVPANTFDNVKGNFPIGFFIWNCNTKDKFTKIETDIFSAINENLGKKNIASSKKGDKTIGSWITQFKDKENECIGMMNPGKNDFQHQSQNYLTNFLKREITHESVIQFTKKFIFEPSIFLSVRQCIPQSWINDRDQFLYPNDNWKNDDTFKSNCLIYTLFHGQNRITSEQGVNHFIPFTREQVGCKKTFKSKFMSDFLAENVKTLSAPAQAVYDSGLELWKYYHSQTDANPDASFYDIRKYFQGVDSKGKMNKTSENERYNTLIEDLREKMKNLAKAIEPKVYEYGFLK